MDTGIVILAAGNSARMGKPKQLLSYKGKTLLNIVCEQALQTAYKPIVVVLGAYEDEILEQYRHPDIHYVTNTNWQAGMSSSIHTGISAIMDQQPEIENIIISVADQVFITAEIFKMLSVQQELTGKNIVACSYAQTIGTPVLFHKNHFEELLSLHGDEGAKRMLKKHKEDTALIEFELGHIDIDTEADYHLLIHGE